MNQKPLSVFLRKHMSLLLCLSLLLLLPVISLLLVFTNGFQTADRITDFSGWASLVAGVMTYISAALLGIAVYYHTWSGQYREEQLDYSMDIVPIYCGKFQNFFDLEDFPAEERKFIYEYTEDEVPPEKSDYAFKRIVIKNYNHRYPQKIKLVKAELSIDEEAFADCTHMLGVASDFHMDEAIDAERAHTLLVGVAEELLKRWRRGDQFHTHTLKLLFHVTNAKNSEYIALSSENDSCITNHVLNRREVQALSLPKPFVSRIWTKENDQ